MKSEEKKCPKCESNNTTIYREPVGCFVYRVLRCHACGYFEKLSIVGTTKEMGFT